MSHHKTLHSDFQLGESSFPMGKDGCCQCSQSSKYEEGDEHAEEAGDDVPEGVEDAAGDSQ